MTSQVFRPLPAALLDRMRTQVSALESATDSAAQLAAIFLIHCECQDAIKRIEAAAEAVPQEI